jgi:predicted RNA-binding protein with TRAM domain
MFALCGGEDIYVFVLYTISMLEIIDKVQSLFTAKIEEVDDGYAVKIPTNEIDLGTLEADGQYKFAIIRDDQVEAETNSATASGDTRRTSQRSHRTQQQHTSSELSSTHGEQQQPPVQEGEQLQVEIENVGEEGDGVAKVDRGYVVMVEGASVGDKPIVNIENVQPNVAFASVVENTTHAKV